MDTIGDFITIIRNASRAGNENCAAQWSRVREGIATTLRQDGFIRGYEVVTDERGFKKLVVALKYKDEIAVIEVIERHSKPGCRKYYPYCEIPRVLNGLGYSILSTSKGIMNDREARKNKVGGELLCKVW